MWGNQQPQYFWGYAQVDCIAFYVRLETKFWLVKPVSIQIIMHDQNFRIKQTTHAH